MAGGKRVLNLESVLTPNYLSFTTPHHTIAFMKVPAPILMLLMPPKGILDSNEFTGENSQAI